MLAMTDALATLDLSSLPSHVRDVLLAQQAIIRAEREAREHERALHAAMREAQAKLEDQNAELSAYNARLEYLVKEFRQALYAKRSEKLNPDQLDLLFEELETAIAQTRAEAETRDPPRHREPAQRNIGRLPEHLPQIEHVIAPASTLCPCGCGEMAKIGEDRTKRLDIIPAQFRVIVTVRPKYACRTCEAGVVQALAPAHLIEGGLPTEALIAHVLVGKYADHLPLYRQAQIYARSGVDLDRSTLAGWVGKAGFHLAPLVDRLAERLKQSKTLFMDETRAPLLDPGRGRTKTGYLWALTRDERGWSGADPPGVVYFYGDGRSGDFAAEFLDGFTGTVQVDGYAGYKQLTREGRNGGPIVLANCWAHARRKLKEIFDASGSPRSAAGSRRNARASQPRRGLARSSPILLTTGRVSRSSSPTAGSRSTPIPLKTASGRSLLAGRTICSVAMTREAIPGPVSPHSLRPASLTALIRSPILRQHSLPSPMVIPPHASTNSSPGRSQRRQADIRVGRSRRLQS